MDTVDVRNHSKCFCVAVCLFDLHVFFGTQRTFSYHLLNNIQQHIIISIQSNLLENPCFLQKISEVFIDPDYTRGGEAERCQKIMVDLWKHWRSATVVITYPIGHWMTGGSVWESMCFLLKPIGHTWRMGSQWMVQWLRTMVIVSPQDLGLWDPFHSWPLCWLINAVDPNYLLPAFIHQAWDGNIYPAIFPLFMWPLFAFMKV